jgi:hypothetical protein
VWIRKVFSLPKWLSEPHLRAEPVRLEILGLERIAASVLHPTPEIRFQWNQSSPWCKKKIAIGQSKDNSKDNSGSKDSSVD